MMFDCNYYNKAFAAVFNGCSPTPKYKKYTSAYSTNTYKEYFTHVIIIVEL